MTTSNGINTLTLAVAFSILLAAPAPLVFAQGSKTPEKPAPWMDKSLSPDRRAELMLEQMTLDEKLQLVHGAGFVFPDKAPDPGSPLARSNGGAGFVPGFPRLGFPDLNLADAAAGITRGAVRSRYATAMPSGLALAATWDPQVAYNYGTLIGRELRDQGYNTSLGGGTNLMREPRNGRNFEYQGEDPVLAGKMVGQLIKGTQSQGIIGDIKHYALNDQETGRHVANVMMDKRTMRETDLLAFELGIKECEPGMVMCSYNRINGDYGCENQYLLGDVLKKSWKFKGFVVSDWWATYSTAKAVNAGLDMEMPDDKFFSKLKQAMESGQVSQARLDDMVHRILRTAFAAGVVDRPPVPKVVDLLAGLETAERVAEQGMVLLKNSGGQLPLNARTIASIAVIGSHADVAVLSGGGSSQVDPPGGNAVPPPPTGAQDEHPLGMQQVVWFPSSPLRALRAKAPAAKVEYNDGSNPASAAALAKNAAVAIVFASKHTTEGFDQPSLALPGNQDALVQAVAAANPHTIVVLETGASATMPWADQVSGILVAWYPGIRGAEAIANILFGDVNPSGKLPITFARSEADLPFARVPGSELTYPPLKADDFEPQWPPFEIKYHEGLKVGYKWFDAEKKTPLFPFGFGLSYTAFAYSHLEAAGDHVSFTLTNTGKCAGAEVAQVYATLPASANEPPKRLVAWSKVALKPGESRTVRLELDPMLLSIFNVDKDDWELVPGEYKVLVGGSSQNTPLTAAIQIGATR